jgi:WD40 repeat protein
MSPTGTVLAAGSKDGKIHLWEVATHAHRILIGHTDIVLSVAFSWDGSQIASSSKDSTVRVWNTATSSLIKAYKDNVVTVLSMAFTPDGTDILTGDAILRGGRVLPDRKHKGTVTGVAVSRNHSTFATCATDKIIYLRDMQTFDVCGSFVGHRNPVCCIAFSPQRPQLVSGADDGVIYLWDVETFRRCQTFVGHTLAINALVWPDACSCFFSASEDLTIRRWDADTGQVVSVIRGLDRPVTDLDALPDSRIVASSSDGSIRIFDRSVRTFASRSGSRTVAIKFVACSPDGALVAACTSDAILRIVDVHTGDVIVVFEGVDSEPVTLTFSPDSSQITMDYTNGERDIWTDRYDFDRPQSNHPPPAVPITFSCDPDGWLYYSHFGESEPMTRYCWIPLDHRWTDWSSQVAWAGNVLAIGTNSGMLSIFDFEPVWSAEFLHV